VGLFQSDPETAEWVNEVLTRLQSLTLLDDSSNPQLGLLNLYRTFLSRLSSQEIAALGSALSSLARLNLTEVFEQEKNLFSSAIHWLKGLSKLKTSDANEIRSILDRTLGQDESEKSGLDQIWDWLVRNLSGHDPQVLKLTFEGLKKFRLKLTERDRNWIREFATANGFQEAYRLLKDSSFESFGSLLKEIKLLSQKGIIREGTSLLSRIENERMQELALTLYNFDQSGELVEILDLGTQFVEKGEKK